jgi:hypothetical protein
MHRNMATIQTAGFGQYFGYKHVILLNYEEALGKKDLGGRKRICTLPSLVSGEITFIFSQQPLFLFSQPRSSDQFHLYVTTTLPSDRFKC